jgi:hypothetical protein
MIDPFDPTKWPTWMKNYTPSEREAFVAWCQSVLNGIGPSEPVERSTPAEVATEDIARMLWEYERGSLSDIEWSIAYDVKATDRVFVLAEAIRARFVVTPRTETGA